MDIDFRLAIPGQAVTHSFLGLGVGERTFSAGEKAIVTAALSLATRKLVNGRLDWTENGEYANADSIAVPGAPAWQRTLRAGAVAIDKKRLARTTENLNLTHVQSAEVSSLRFTVNGGNPLFPAAPNIHADLLLQIRPEGGGFAAKLTGTHDRFPGYVLKINGRVLYNFDPVAAGSSPDSLFGPAPDEAVATHWIVFHGS
jgi:hypothetical protein